MLKDNTSKNNEKRAQHGKGDGLLRLLAPTLIGVLIFTVCLCGTTWAWFSATLQGDVAEIQAASFQISVTVENDTEPVATFSSTNDATGMSYTLNAGTVYTVTIESTGSAKTGHCIVKLGDAEYPTETFTSIENGWLKFQVFSVTGATLSFADYCWGQYSGELRPYVTNGCVLTDTGVTSGTAGQLIEPSEPSEQTEESTTAEPTTESTDSTDADPTEPQSVTEAVTTPATEAPTEAPSEPETTDPNA